MHYRRWYPSKYVCAEDLAGQDVMVTIATIALEEMPNDGDQKPVLYFVGMRKGMVCNATNAKRIAKMYGPDTDGWVGREITLYPSEVDMRGDTVPCIRVRPGEQTNYEYSAMTEADVPQQPAQQPETPPPSTPPTQANSTLVNSEVQGGNGNFAPSSAGTARQPRF